jgi:hypothetical protein
VEELDLGMLISVELGGEGLEIEVEEGIVTKVGD